MIQDFITCADPAGTHRMAFTEWGRPSAVPSIVCVHGLTRNGRDFDRVAEALAASGRHVLCPDMVGRGKSDDLPGHPENYTYAQYIADITALLASKNIKEVDWIGTSMGGLIGFSMAAVPETPIRRFVINDVGPYIPLAALKRIAAYVAMVIEFADMAQLERHVRQIYAPFGIVGDEDWKHITQNSFRTLPNGKFVLAHDPGIAKNFAALDADVDLWPLYEAIKVPCLLLRGETSDVLSAEVAEAMTARGPKARLITYQGVGHAPGLMDARQIADILSFLN